MGKIGQPARSTMAVLLLAGAAAAVFGSWACSSGPGPARVDPITIGTMSNAGDALIFTAQEQGYFRANGLDVALKTYDNGLDATDGMLAGEVELAYATEFVVVGKALQKQDVSMIAVYSMNETVGLAGRKDRGIEAVPDLKGKKIGLALGTINEFYLGRLLSLNGLSTGDVTLVGVKLAELADALGSGSVDAVIAGSRHLAPVIQQQGADVFVWPAHSGQPAYGTLVGSGGWVTGHPDLVERLLKSLAEAEEYVNRDLARARSALQQRLGYDDEYMAQVWSEYQFSLSLHQSLITAMEDEARWMIGNGLTEGKDIPDFLRHVYVDGLKKVKPEAVDVIG